MACCTTLQNITLGCDKGVGGMRKAWIACYGDITSVTVTESETGDKITAITPVTSPPWIEVEFRPQTGSATTTPTVDNTAGTLYHESSIVIQISKQDAQKRMAINALMKSDLVVIIQDGNKNYWYYGYDFPVTLGDGTIDTGTALGDFNGYNITLTDLSNDIPYPVDPSVVESIQVAINGEEPTAAPLSLPVKETAKTTTKVKAKQIVE